MRYNRVRTFARARNERKRVTKIDSRHLTRAVGVTAHYQVYYGFLASAKHREKERERKKKREGQKFACTFELDGFVSIDILYKAIESFGRRHCSPSIVELLNSKYVWSGRCMYANLHVFFNLLLVYLYTVIKCKPTRTCLVGNVEICSIC